MGENCVIIRSLVSSQHQRVTDGQTDGQTDAWTVDMPHVATARRTRSLSRYLVWSEGRRPLGAVLRHQMNRVNSRNGSAVVIAP